MSFVSALPGLDRLDEEAQRQLLKEVFADAGWEVPRILAALDHTSWFLERLSQVRMRHWTAGHAVLIGDTAWAPTPVTGMGTSLALVGASRSDGITSPETVHSCPEGSDPAYRIPAASRRRTRCFPTSRTTYAERFDAKATVLEQARRNAPKSPAQPSALKKTIDAVIA